MRGKQSFIKGAVVLGGALMISKFLGIFFRWPVTMLIGDEGVGLYQLVYPVYMFLIGALSGFPIAISRMVSERIALGRRYGAYRVFKCSLFALTLIGAVCSIFLYIASPYIIKVLKWKSEVYYSFAAISFAPLFVAIMNSFRGYFQGLQMMNMPAASQIIEQFGRVVVGVFLTYMMLPYGVGYGAAGASFGACAGAIMGCFLLIFGYLKNRKVTIPSAAYDEREGWANIVRELILTAVPISVGTAVNSIMALIDSIVVPGRLMAAGFTEKVATELYGQLTGKAHVLINVPLALSMALSTSLVPAISEVKASRNISRVRLRTESAVKAAMIVGLPSSLGLYILADPILHLIFPGKSEGAEILQILSASVLFIVLVQILVGILNGMGNVISPMKNLAIGSAVKLILSYILTSMPLLNVKGAALSSVGGHVVAAALNFRDMAKVTYFTFDIDKMLLRPLLSTLLMGISVNLVYNRFMDFTGSNGISTIVSVVVGIIVYILLILLLGCIDKDELKTILRRKPKK